MKYQENQKVTVQSEDWYNSNKQPNGFIVVKDPNGKISTFSPGMVKFCGKTFTVGKAVTGSSFYPDHYTFVEDGGSYKWTDDMIAGPADDGAPTYSPSQTEQPKPAAAPKPQPKPAEPQTKPAEPKPEPKPAEQPKKEPKPKTASVQKPEPQKEPKKEMTEPRPVETTQAPEPVPQSVHVPEHQPQTAPAPESKTEPAEPEDLPAFETYTILLKARQGAQFQDCAVQAFRILRSNDIFPSVTFDFNGFDVIITRK